MIKEKFRQTAIKIIHFLNKLKTQLIVILQQTNRTNLNTKFTSIKINKQYKTNHENNHWNNIVILINQVIFFRQIPQQPQQPHQEFSQKRNQAPPSKNTQKNHTNTQGYQPESIRSEIQNLITLLLTATRNNRKSIYKLYTNTKHSRICTHQ